MREGCHVYTTQHALVILRALANDPGLFVAPSAETPAWMPATLATSLAATGAGYDTVSFETGNCDHQKDVELVDVDGPFGSWSRDNPHKAQAFADDDEPHYESDGNNFTAFSHFIDLRKGPGLYDDYDGYSYDRGSASRDEHEPVAEWASISLDDQWDVIAGRVAKAAVGSVGYGVDGGLALFLADEYVHAPGHPWYRPGRCSPALERYTHVALFGPLPPNVTDHRLHYQRFSSNEAECKSRFPLGESRTTLADDVGYPASVFAPVDNLALANWRDFEATADHASLGRVLHGIQNASVPHHAAGTCGNYHRRYERTIEDHIVEWANDPGVLHEVRTYLAYWDREDPDRPTSIGIGDEHLLPAENWEIDQLVTWVALHAYDAYANVYGGFSNGNAFDEASARSLLVKALAMSAHVVRRAARQLGLMPPRIKIPVKPGTDWDVPPIDPTVGDGDDGDNGRRDLPDPGTSVRDRRIGGA